MPQLPQIFAQVNVKYISIRSYNQTNGCLPSQEYILDWLWIADWVGTAICWHYRTFDHAAFIINNLHTFKKTSSFKRKLLKIIDILKRIPPLIKISQQRLYSYPYFHLVIKYVKILT